MTLKDFRPGQRVKVAGARFTVMAHHADGQTELRSCTLGSRHTVPSVNAAESAATR